MILRAVGSIRGDKLSVDCLHRHGSFSFDPKSTLQTGSTACFATLYLAPTGRIEPFWVQKILVDLRPKGGRIEGRSERLRHGDLAMTATAAKRKGRRSRAKLTQRQLNGRLEPGRYSDGGNLYFEVRPSRRALLAVPLHNRRQEVGDGPWGLS
jgi:hypothetical protein